MQPYVAATLLEVAKPYMEDYARVLDPFCGSGVTLIERCLIKPVKFSLGLDIFTKGLEAAKRNAKAADIDMHFVHKDSLRFVNTELFDEIITDKKLEIDKITDQADKDQDKEARNQGVFPVTRSFLRSLGPVCFSRRSFQHGGFLSLWLSVSLLFVIFQFLHPLLLSGYTVPE